MSKIFDKVLVTGGAGYCGSLLVPQLLDEGYKVTVYDTMFFGDAFLPKDNPNLRVVKGDIRDTAHLAATTAGHDAFVSLACISNDASFELDEALSTSVNMDAFEPMVVAAKQAGVKRFVYASSSSVYGDATTIPQVEDKTGRPLSPYAATKATNELYASVFQRNYGLQTVGLRYFNVFGRRQDPNGAYAAVIPRWVDRLLRDEQCEIFGDGGTSRDFCYIANAVQANILAATTANPATTGMS